MRRLGIFGGAFDPIHIGHLIAAEKTREEFKLEKILFIPCNIPPHKELPVASAQDRLKMTHLATKDNPFFEASDIEIKKGGISYTADTIQIMSSPDFIGVPCPMVHLIIGGDEAENFINWKEHLSLMNSLNFIILTRPNFNRKKVNKIFENKAHFCNLNIDIASTYIRELIHKEKSIKYLVPEPVQDYIKKKKLYK